VDFSENGTLQVKLEPQSRYFNEIQYTLLGIVCEVWVQDLAESVFESVHDLPGAQAKALILEGFAERHEDAIITLSFAFVSSDLHHDPAFVQHAFDKLLTPWFNAHVAPGEGTHIRRVR
jgi:hypothetical protein